jgi:uncharacterized membrane protein
MASPASIGGHPVHPMIIPFPIALWVFSLVADLIYLWRGNPVWRDYIAFYTLLGGIIGAVVAAVPGFIDWLSLNDRDSGQDSQLACATQRHSAIDIRGQLLSADDEWRRPCERQLHNSNRAIRTRGHLDFNLRLFGR